MAKKAKPEAKRGRGRPPKDPEDKVKRVVCYLKPWAYEVLDERAPAFETASGIQLNIEKYAKQILESEAAKILAQQGKTPPVET